MAAMIPDILTGLPISDWGLWGLGLLLVAAFAAGLVDAMAGGGGFIFLPSCLLVGMPAQLALEQNKATAAFGTLAAIGNFARKGIIPWRAALWGAPFSLVGSAIGANMLMGLSAKQAMTVIVVLLPVAFAVSSLGQRLKATSVGEHEDRPVAGRSFWLVLPLVCLVIGWYDGFFGPGTGTLLLLFLNRFLGMSLLRSTALAKVLNFGSNAGALATFFLEGQIIMALVLPLAAMNIAGNLTGSQLAIKKGQGLLKKALTFSLLLLMVSVAAKWLLLP